MASELSQFIEKELKSQDTHDDEHQRLLDDLRSKPLPVVPLPFYKRGVFRKLMIVFAVVAVLALAIAGTVVTGASQGLKTGIWGASVGSDSSDADPVVVDMTSGQKGGETHDRKPGKHQDVSPSPKDHVPKPAQDKAADSVEDAQTEDEDDVEDYEGEGSEQPKLDDEEAYEDYGEMIEKIEEANKEGDKEAHVEGKSKDEAKSPPLVTEEAREPDVFDVDYGTDYDDYTADVQDPVIPDSE